MISLTSKPLEKRSNDHLEALFKDGEVKFKFIARKESRNCSFEVRSLQRPFEIILDRVCKGLENTGGASEGSWRIPQLVLLLVETLQVVTDVDLKALVSHKACHAESIWKLGGLQVTCGTIGLSTATVKLVNIDGSTHVACSIGIGAVDSTYKAINLVVKEPTKLLDYSLNSVTEGIGVNVTARVVICRENNHTSTYAFTEDANYPTFSGIAAEMDVVVSTAKAYLVALNKLLRWKESFRCA
ncbi:putative 2-isopropylmalate synthase [Glycine soja]|uniref:Putative 2-isopropylmalate synthase n=1 Tax=Glycine soja TaxID=3848 RepID=A0A445I3K7_GLYSO|nr:putative 2-isopropylmalate synthase [Glycine soja]